MGYLDNASVTVDAVLTKKGREILKNGGSLDIQSFTASDTGVDYTLWNADHPSGSAFYGEAIENLPMMEASVHADQALRNRLVTLPANTITIPTLELRIPSTTTRNLTFENEHVSEITQVTANLKGYNAGAEGTALYVIVEQPSVVVIGAPEVAELSGIARNYVREAGIQRAAVYQINNSPTSAVMWNIPCSPDVTQLVAGRKANITVLEAHTGAYDTFTITNNVTKLSRNLLGTLGTVGSTD